MQPQQAAAAVRRLAVVTGANQGIGKEIARALGSSGQFHVVATARRADAGEEAVRELQAAGVDVELFAPLELTDQGTVDALAHFLSQRPLAVLVNNAGYAFKGDIFGPAEARKTIDVNYRGTARVTEALLPALRRGAAADPENGARVINVCSMAGHLSIVAPPLQARLQNPELTKADVDALAAEFEAGVEDGSYGARGWPKSMYGVSKLLEIAVGTVWARDLAGEGIVVNSCCPGYVSTAMSSYKGHKTPAQGAETPVWLATRHGSPPASLSGGFYQDKQLISW